MVLHENDSLKWWRICVRIKNAFETIVCDASQPLSEKNHHKHADWHRRRSHPKTVCFDVCSFPFLRLLPQTEERSGLLYACLNSAQLISLFIPNFPIRCAVCIENQFRYNLILSHRHLHETDCSERNVNCPKYRCKNFHSIHSMLEMIFVPRNAHLLNENVSSVKRQHKP